MAVWKKEYQAFLDDVTEKSKKENDGAAKTAPSAISLDDIITRFGAPMPQQQRQMIQQSDATKRANANVIRNQAQAMMGTDMLNINDQQLMDMYKQADALNSGMNSQLAMAGSDPRVAQYSPQLRQAQMTLEKAQRTMGRDRGGVIEGWKNTGKSAAQLREEAYQERLKGINTPDDYAQLMTDLDDTERKANLFQRGSTVRMQANKEFAAMLPYMTDEQLQQVYDAAYSNLGTGSKVRDTILGIWPGAKTTIYNKSAGPLDIFGTDDPETQFLKDVRKEQERRKAAYGTNLEENAQALWDRMTPEQQTDYNYYYRPYAGADDVMDKGRWAAEQIKAQQIAELNAAEGGLWDSLPQEAKMAAAGEWGSRMHIPDAKEQEDWARKYLQDKIGADVDAMLTEPKEWVDPLGAEDRAIVDQRVNEYLNFSAKGYMGKTASEIYAAQAEEKAEGWRQASMGQYAGDDQDIKNASDAFAAAEARLDELNDMLIDMDPAEDPELYAATEAQIAQLANELNGMHENINALAAGETTDLNEIKRYLYGDASIWRLIGSSAMQGATNFAQGTYQTANMLLGQPINAIGQAITGKQYTSGLTKWTQDYQQYAQGWSQEAENAVQALGGGAVYRAINNTISNMVENIPNTLMSIMSGRMMSAGELASVQNQAISALNAMGMERTAAQTVMQSMIRDPQYWLSFMREAGSDYQEAIDDGADMTTASVYAFVTAFINSGIEIGVEGDSGYEGIGKDKDGGFMGKVLTAVTGKDLNMLASILESAGEEGGEEFEQTLVSGLLKKAMYNANMQYVSFDENTDAVFNLPKTGREMLYGALAGGMMAGTMEPATSYISNIATDTQTGSQIIGNDQAQALAGIAEDSAHIHNKTTEAIKNGTLDVNSRAGQRAVGKLWRETYAGLDKASQAALDGMVTQPVQRQLQANGYEGDVAEAARVVAKEYHGGRLSKPERAIMDDPMVADIAAKLWEGEFGEEGIEIDESDVKRQNYQLQTTDELNQLMSMPNLNKQDTHSTDQEGAKPELSQVNTNKFGAVGAKEEDLDQATGMVPDDENGTETAQLFGELGRSQEDLETTLKNNDITFDKEAVAKAYEAGKNQRRQKAAERLERIKELNQGGKNGTRNGVVRSVSAEEAEMYNVKRMTRKMSKKQYAAVQALRKVAGRMNLNIVLYESQVNEDGKRVGAQGFYDTASDTVYLDMFAGYGNEQAILRTAAHELTHVIQKWSPEKYNALQEFLSETYYKNGENTLNELLQAQMGKAKDAGHDLDEAGAMDEVTADAMEMMLSDADAIRNLAQKDEGLFKKIKNWIDDFVNSIRAAMEGIDPHSREARILEDMRTEWETLQGMWLDAFNDAAQNRGGDYVEAELQDMQNDVEGTVVKRQRVSEPDVIITGGETTEEVEKPAAKKPKAKPEAKPAPAKAWQNTGVAYTNDQTPVEFHYALVDQNELIASNNSDFSVNESYPQELQPRDRTRAASRDQVTTIAKDLNQARLGESADIQSGAPIIGSDNVVESGNGRVMALRYAMSKYPKSAAKYTAWLRENASRFGLDPNQVTDGSVLVRVRDTDMPRTGFVKAANESVNAAYSETENAESDAEKLTPSMMEMLTPSENGNLDNIENVGFANRFMDKIIPKSERGNYTQQDGRISQRGWERMRNAIFQRAYGSSALTQLLSESTDNNVQNVLKALLQAAARAVQVQEQVRKGQLYDVNIGEAIANAAKRYAQLKKDGIKLETYLSQTYMPGFEMETPGEVAIMRMLDKYSRAPKQLAGAMRTLYSTLAEYGNPDQTNMLGENVKPDLESIVDRAEARYEKYGDDVANDNLLFSERDLAEIAAEEERYNEMTEGFTNDANPENDEWYREHVPGYKELREEREARADEYYKKYGELKKTNRILWDQYVNGTISESEYSEGVKGDEIKSLEREQRAFEKENTRKALQAIENYFEEINKIVEDVASRAGYTDKAYHGTNAFGFTRFDMSKSQNQIFVAYSTNIASTYGTDISKKKIGIPFNAEVANKLSNEAFLDRVNELIRKTDFGDTNSIKMITRDQAKQYIKDKADKAMDAALGDGDEFWDENTAKLISTIKKLGNGEEISEAEEYAAHVYIAGANNRALSENWQDALSASKALHNADGNLFAVIPTSRFERTRILSKGTLADLIRIETPNSDRGGIYSLLTRPGRQLVVDAKGENWNRIKPEWEQGKKKWKTREIAEYARSHGYDSVRINNVFDNGGMADNDLEDGYGDIGIFFKESDVKSADPVTYDDNGNIIPLRERFKPENPDIRYSDRETTEKELSKESKQMNFGRHPSMLQFSVRSAVEATGLTVEVDENGVQKYVLYHDGVRIEPGSFTADMVKNTPVGRLIELGQRFAVNKRAAEKNAIAQREFIATIINMISLYQDAAAVWELTGSLTFSALKTNGDPQYSDSYDFGSICAKTQAILNVISETQVRKGRGLTKEEIDGIVYEEVGKGVYRDGKWIHGATPCPPCYVYATWVNKPARLEMVRNFILQYQNWTDEQINTFMNAEPPTGATETETKRLKTEMNQRKLWMKLCLAEQVKNPDGTKTWKRRAKPEFCPNEILLDLRRSSDMATKYPGTWNFMQRGGNALGKAIAPYSDSRVGETIVGKANGADAIGKKLMNDEIGRMNAQLNNTEYKPKFINPFLTGNAKQAEKIFKKAMVNIKKQNLKGGQRWQSWSDFRAEWGSDYLMEMLTMQLLGSQVQTYTKVVEAVDLLASAGFEVNLSGIPYGDGFWHNEDGSIKIDKNGNVMLRFSAVTGINPEAAMAFVKKYGAKGNVQFMTIGISDAHIRAALLSNDVTFVIPFHGSGGSVKRLQHLMNLLSEQMSTGDDYTNAQSDSFAEYEVIGEGKKAKKINKNPNWAIREAILTGNYDRLNKEQKNAVKNNEYLNRLYRERYVDKNAEAYGAFFSKSEAQQIYPYEYWDKYTTLATADVNSLRFIEYCQMLGVVPRFSGLTKKDKDGNDIEYANFSGARRDATGKIIGYDPVPGYWKLLIDRSMYNRVYDESGNLMPDQCEYHQPQTVSVNDIDVGAMPVSANNTVGYADDEVREISERVMQRIEMKAGQNKAAGDALEETQDDNVQNSLRDEEQRIDGSDNIVYSLRTDPAPKKVVYGYKAFYARDGKLYPPMVSNITDEEQKVSKATSGTMKGLPTPVGVWLDADVGGILVDENGVPVRATTTGRLRVKNAKSGGDASLAFRPGWHLGEWPDAKQFNKMDPETGERTRMPDDLVFALCEISADYDYQLDALSYGINAKGGFSRSQAGLPWIPRDGYYKYRTNVDPTTAPWLIAGAIRVIDILDDDDCAAKCAEFGITPDTRVSGKKINLADYGLKRGPVTPDTEGMERFLKNDASRANDALLENALTDPTYANAYVQRPINFDNKKQYEQLKKEFEMNGQDIEMYRNLYNEQGYLGRENKTQYSERDYDQAVRSNDEDAQQQMVLEAAEAAMPDSVIRDEEGNLLQVYHGTDADFTEFDMSKGRANMDIQGAFFSPWELDASGYGAKVGTYYLDIKNPAPEDVAYAALNRFKGQNNAGRRAREYLINQGYDGVNGEGMEFIAFYPEQIKSADPVTYDDEGNVIPLAERFNPAMSDFRFSDRDTNYKTDREILADALESVAANEEERKMLAEYKQLASTLDSDERKIRELNDQIRDLRLENPNSDQEKQLVKERNEIQRAINAADKKLYNMERMAPLRRIAKDERKKAENDLQRAREHMLRYREGIMKREYIGRIERTSRRLAKWLTAPAGKSNNYVPESLRKPLGEFLMTIEKISAQRRAGGPMTEEDKKFARQMQEIEHMLRNIESGRDGDVAEEIAEQYGAYVDLPKGFTDTLAQLVSKVQERMESAGTHNILDEMSMSELEALDMTMTAISSSITHINDFLSGAFTGSVSETAEKTINDMREYKARKQGVRGVQRAADYILWDNVMPVYAFERLGEGGRSVFRALREGQDRLAFNAKRIIDLAESLYTSEEAQNWSKEIVEFQNPMTNEPIRMTVAHLMSLYALSRRDQALGHLLGEGFRVADFKDKRQTVTDKGHVINELSLHQMFQKLTERQKQVAESLVNTMSTVGSDWGNYVSMRRFGFRQFTEKNYFPIKSDSDLLPAKTDTSTGNELYKLLNMSMTKPLTLKANNRIMVENIFDVFAGHMADMAQYNAMALPVLDAVKWLNYKASETTEGETTKYTDGVRDAIRDAFGTTATKYLTELLKDVNGGGQVNDTGIDLTQKMLGRYNRVAVAANLRVALLQPLAIIRAANELPGTSLAKGTIKAVPRIRAEIAEMQEKSGIALWKSLGYRETNIGRSVKQQIQHMETLTDKISDKSMILAELGDQITWASMWKASKEYIRKNRRDLTPGTDEFFAAVVEKFEDVIYNTQVVDSILTKSQLMRSSKTTNRMLSSFMSEPTTTFNTLMRSWDKIRLEMLKGKTFAEAWQKNGLNMGKTALIFLISAAVETVISQLMSAYRDDDDYETFKDKVLDGWEQTFADNANPLTLLPGVKQLYEAGIKPLLGMETFDDQNVLTEGISTTVKGIQKIMNGQGTVWGRAYTLAKGISMTAGIPIHPVMREFQALWNNSVVRINPSWRLETSVTPQAVGYDLLYDAYAAGDTERVDYLTSRLNDNGYSDEKIQSAMTTRIKKETDAGDITAEEAQQRLQQMAGMDENAAYYKAQQMTDDDGSYSRFDNLEQAIKTGTGYKDAVDELTSHGYAAKDVESKARSIITKMAIDDNMSESAVQNLLKQYGNMDANEAYIRSQELRYQQLTGNSTTADAAMVFYAIDNKQSPKAAIDGLKQHGKDAKSIASSVSSKYKSQYLDLVQKGKTSEAAALKGRLITVFDYLGVDGAKRLADWEKDK